MFGINSWQDFVLSTCGTFFCAALLPTLRNPFARIPRKTSVSTALGLAVVAVTYASLGLLYSTLVQALCAGMWAYLAVARPAGASYRSTLPSELMRPVPHPSTQIRG